MPAAPSKVTGDDSAELSGDQRTQHVDIKMRRWDVTWAEDREVTQADF